MASYYEDYDPRLRPRQKEEVVSRSKDNSYSRLTPPAEPPKERYGRPDDRADNVQNFTRNTSYANSRSYDSRYQYTPPRARSRNSYPPQPTCEDEVASLAKEAGSQSLLSNVEKDEAVQRGTIDQEPIVEDVYTSPPDDARESEMKRNQPRAPKSSGVPTPPPSDDERARKATRKPSRLNMNFNTAKEEAVPELSKRESTPYAFSGGQARNQTRKENLLSPETLLSPPPTGYRSRSKTRGQSRSQPSSPVRETPRAKQSQLDQGYFTGPADENALDDSPYDINDTLSRSAPRPTPMYPTSRGTIPQPSVADFAPQSNLAPPRSFHLDARRNTSTDSSLPSYTGLRVDNTRHPTPLVISNMMSDPNDAVVYSSPTTPTSASELPMSSSRVHNYNADRGISPGRSATDPPSRATPPQTPRTSLDFLPEGSINSSPASRTNSISTSANNSRPSSPSPRTPSDASRFPKSEMDWGTLLAANTAKRSTQPSRVASLRQETMPARPMDPRIPPMPSRNSSLPYPVDDGPLTPTVWMPSERHHQYFPEPRPAPPMPITQEAKTLSRTASPGPINTPPTIGRAQRPAFQPRHSAVDLPKMANYQQQQPEKPRANETKRMSSFNDPSQAKKDAQVLVEKALPTCSRSQPVSGYSDWYTMIGAPSLDFCPGCIDYMERTVFRLSFRKSPPRSLDTRITCALGGMPWIRLAWLLTLQRQRSDLNLLKDIAEIEDTTEPCPGDRLVARAWYGLRDPDGLFVRGFCICYNDVKKIERLLPSLNGIFVPVPHRTSYEKQLCAIRPEGNRFSIYLDALVSTHERALTSRKSADSLPFIELVERRQRLRECTKDSLLLNQLWHYIPSVPELTVCEDCFETVVEPEVKKNKSIAKMFNRTVQPAYGETMGSSCQLYSPRMRRIFRRALQENDTPYLARKARERRDAELRLQEKYREVQKKAKRLSLETKGDQQYEEKLDREIRRITDEWQTHWE